MSMKPMKEADLEIEASVSFERKIAINYQSYAYHCTLTQTLKGRDWDEINLRRDLLRQRVRHAVYNDLAQDLDVVITKCMQYVNIGAPLYASIKAQGEALREEAQITIDECLMKMDDMTRRIDSYDSNELEKKEAASVR